MTYNQGIFVILYRLQKLFFYQKYHLVKHNPKDNHVTFVEENVSSHDDTEKNVSSYHDTKEIVSSYDDKQLDNFISSELKFNELEENLEKLSEVNLEEDIADTIVDLPVAAIEQVGLSKVLFKRYRNNHGLTSMCA